MTSRQNDIERDVATHAERHLRDCFDVDVVAITMVDADGRSGADRLTRAMAFRVRQVAPSRNPDGRRRVATPVTPAALPVLGQHLTETGDRLGEPMLDRSEADPEV